MKEKDKEKELLFEIGIEEVPARFLPQAIDNLKNLAGQRFAENGIPFGGMSVFATPRRLALIARDLPENQPDRIREVFGPPEKMSFDKDGNPSKALTGFAKGLGLAPEQLVAKEKGKNPGRYMAAVIEEKGSPLKAVLPGLLREMTLSLSFPKSMRWGTGSMRFVRPIRWIAALFDSETLQMEIDGTKSGNITRGHRFLSPVAFQLRDARSYEKILHSNFVIVDQDKRREMILDDLERLASTVSGRPVMDEGLLNTVVYLVEYPVGMLCEFPKEYLELPEELLITVMQDHQKYFAIKDDKGRLINNFTVISNTLKENYFVVKAGSERVIRARFEDARFYYHEDRKRPLAARVEELKKVAFHERLGSLHDKLLRIQSLVAHIAGVACPESIELAKRAAILSKSDLVTGVVREFPELQGIMGRYYALNDGESPEVAEAILEQYLPRHMGDALPSTKIGAALSLADRLDNIASFFHLGLAPTGSEDPFALRRQAIAVSQVLIEGGYELAIDTLTEKALEGLGQRENSELESSILKFFASRLPQIFEARGFIENDLTDSLMGMALQVPLKYIIERRNAIRRFKQTPGYNAFLLAIKRVKNILPRDLLEKQKKQKLPSVDAGLFRETAEGELFEKITAAKKQKISGLLSEHRYEEALSVLSKLTGPVNGFFDAVLVMDKDEAVRQNRLALLGSLWELASGICDFSRLSEV